MSHEQRSYLREYTNIVSELSDLEREPQRINEDADGESKRIDVYFRHFVDKFPELKTYPYLVGELYSLFCDSSRMGYLGEYMIDYAIEKSNEYCETEKYIVDRIAEIKEANTNIDVKPLDEIIERSKEWRRAMSLGNTVYITHMMESLKKRADAEYASSGTEELKRSKQREKEQQEKIDALEKDKKAINKEPPKTGKPSLQDKIAGGRGKFFVGPKVEHEN